MLIIEEKILEINELQKQINLCKRDLKQYYYDIICEWQYIATYFGFNKHKDKVLKSLEFAKEIDEDDIHNSLYIIYKKNHGDLTLSPIPLYSYDTGKYKENDPYDYFSNISSVNLHLDKDNIYFYIGINSYDCSFDNEWEREFGECGESGGNEHYELEIPLKYFEEDGKKQIFEIKEKINFEVDEFIKSEYKKYSDAEKELIKEDIKKLEQTMEMLKGKL